MANVIEISLSTTDSEYPDRAVAERKVPVLASISPSELLWSLKRSSSEPRRPEIARESDSAGVAASNTALIRSHDMRFASDNPEPSRMVSSASESPAEAIRSVTT